MFYPTNLLHHKNSIVLQLAWLAATRGVNSIKRDQLEKCDITKLCKTILQFLQSQSSDPKKRFSLRLSAMFVHGTIIIWGKQVAYVEHDASLWLKSRQEKSARLPIMPKEQDGSTQDSFKTPRAPKKKKKKATKKVFDTPESLIEISERNVEQFVDNLGRAVPDTDVIQLAPEEIIAQPDARVSDARQEPFPLGAFDEPEGLQQDPRQLLAPEMVVHADVHAPAEPEVHPLPSVQQEVTIIEAEGAMPEKIVVPETQPEVVPAVQPVPEVAESVASKKEYPKKTIAQKLLVRPRRFKLIDKDWAYEEEEFPMGFESPLPKFRPSKNFWPDSDVEFRAREATAETRGTDISDVPSYSLPDSSTPRVFKLPKGSTSAADGRLVTSTPKRPLSVERTIVDEMAPAGHNGQPPPAKRRRLKSHAAIVRVEDVEDFKVPEAPSLMLLSEKLPEETPLPDTPFEPLAKKQLSPPRADFGQKWYTEIMEIVNDLVKITPVDICKNLQKRVSKWNMAIIFATLLVLCKRGRVRLRTVPGSSELEIVEKA